MEDDLVGTLSDTLNSTNQKQYSNSSIFKSG